MYPYLFLFASVLLLFACQSNDKESVVAPIVEKAQSIVNQAIAYHGGENYQNLALTYTFRDKQYRIQTKGENYTYFRFFEEDGKQVEDRLTADDFERSIDGKTVALPDSMVQRYSNSVNSVNYFTLLPYRLNDEAVYKKHIGITDIKGKTYDVVEVTFSEESGGDDFEDQYYYWFDAETRQMDYLAYKFFTDKGGVRFRVAYNMQDVQGVRLQDYENYEAPKETSLSDLPSLYEAGELKLLSTIEIENIQS